MSLTAAQRAARASRVGASEVAALLQPSQHPFTTAAAIYDRIVNGIETEVSPRMTAGQLLEPCVLSVARKYWRLDAFACHRAYVHPHLPVTASPDAYIGDGAGLVEIKTTSASWTDQPPAHVVVQVQTQLWLSHRSYAQVVVLSGSSLGIYQVDRDDVLIRQIEDAVAAFAAEHLLPHVRPAEPSREFRLEKPR